MMVETESYTIILLRTSKSLTDLAQAITYNKKMWHMISQPPQYHKPFWPPVRLCFLVDGDGFGKVAPSLEVLYGAQFSKI